jgi:dipeptidyl aminopeptidase/acylaminoacyl peptidase
MLYKDSLIADAIWGRAYLKDTIELDETQLKKFSPINQLEHFKILLLSVHGEKDSRASIEQAEELEERLEQLNKNYTYITYDDEGHYFFNESNRLDYYQKVVDFLHRYNPVD